MIQNPHKSKFVLVEGIDGSGKSQQYVLIENLMRAYFPKVGVKYAKEPDNNRLTGKVIYEILNGTNQIYDLKKMHPLHFQSFYIEDRMCNYRQNIIPSLQCGFHVIQDRGVASSFCYGAQTPDEFYDFMGLHDRIFSAAQMPFFWPDLIIIYDVPVDVAIRRMVEAGKVLDQFEQKDKLERARINYLAFADRYPDCVVVNGEAEPKQVFMETRNLLLPVLGLELNQK